MRNKKKIIISLVMILLLVIVTVGVTFAAFMFTQEGTVENIVESSTIMLTYTEGKTGITLNEAYPISDDKGKVLVGENNVFDFTVQATLGKSNIISYEVTAVKIPITDMTPLEDNEVKLYLERAIDPDTTYQEVLPPSNFLPIENQSEIGSPIGSMILDSGIFINKGTTIHNYRLRLWVDESAQIPSGETRKYGVKVNVYAKQLMMTEESCFTFDSSTGTITDYSDTCPKDVVIPDTINGVPVTTIGSYAFQNNQLTSAIIPNGITKIEELAFLNNQLTSVEIPNNVTSIGPRAFENNQLPDEQAFIYKRNTDGSIDYTTVIGYGGAKKENVVIPTNITTIGPQAFYGSGLISVTIPDSVTSIERVAFAGNRLTNVVIPNSVTTIGAHAFMNTQLASVTIGNNVKTIETYAFQNNQLTNVELPTSVTTIGSYAFNRNQLTSVEIPNNVTSIGIHAFSINSTLKTIVNKTGKAFDWNSILRGPTGTSFVTGSVGSVTITSE